MLIIAAVPVVPNSSPAEPATRLPSEQQVAPGRVALRDSKGIRRWLESADHVCRHTHGKCCSGLRCSAVYRPGRPPHVAGTERIEIVGERAGVTEIESRVLR